MAIPAGRPYFFNRGNRAVLHAQDRFGHEVATARFWDVGVPVSTDADMFQAWAWDDDPPRPFLVTRVWSEGTPINEQTFERLVAGCHHQPAVEGEI
ncbi:MAG: hypothetical protein ABI768_07570 [Acidobacteriota bacterium]